MKWVKDPDGNPPTPACVDCCQLMLNPLFVDAVYSVSIDKFGSPTRLMRAAIETYHEQGHKSA